jgi:hypothetical protein
MGRAEEIAGINAAQHTSEALARLGFSPGALGEEGLRVLSRFDTTDLPEKDKSFLEGATEWFESIRDEPSPEEYAYPLTGAPSMSEYMVVEGLIEALSELSDEQMPWTAQVILDALDDYDQYLAALSRKDWDPTGRGRPSALQERADRIRHSVVDIQQKAAGRA